MPTYHKEIESSGVTDRHRKRDREKSAYNTLKGGRDLSKKDMK
jgi:hypothetical protein